MNSSSNTASLMSFPSCMFTRRNPARRLVSGLQITVHEVDLLQAAKALADVLRTHVAHALHGFQLRVGGGEYLVQPLELADDRLDHHLRKAWDSPEDAVAARSSGMVEGVQLPVVAEKLGQAAEVEQVLVRQSRQ